MHHHFQAEQWVPYPLPAVFAFFANPANLPPLMPPWQQARIDRITLRPAPNRPGDAPADASSPAAGAGTTMTLSFRALPWVPVRLPWDARITEFTWNEHFCDVIDGRGPFRFWRHCHRLTAETRKGQPGTLLRDQVEFALPGGPAGDLLARTVMPLQFRYLFRFRHRKTAELLPRAAAGA